MVITGTLNVGGLGLINKVLNFVSGSGKAGVRYNSLTFAAGTVTKKENIALPLVGSISGTVKLLGRTDNAGIDIYIPGTGYIAKTDTDGKFSLAEVPVGTHNIFAESQGFHRGRVEGVAVATDANTEIDTMSLALETGAAGFILIENDAAYATSRTVSVNIGATSDATLMKISESITFDGASWEPLKATASYTFPTVTTVTGTPYGKASKTLYVQFANANGLPSSPFSDSILLDLFHDIGSVAINAGVAETALRLVTLTIVPPANATQMLIGNDTTFTGATWETVAASKQITLPAAQSSTNIIYTKFRNVDLYESDAISDSINLVMYTQAGGGITIQGTNPSLTRVINFAITVPTYSTSMIISTNSDFSGASWETVATTKQITVPNPGSYVAYAKFKDVDGIEFTNANWIAAFVVNIFNDGGAVSINAGASQTSLRSVTLTITRPTNATHMMIDNEASFTGATWETALASKQYVLPAAQNSSNTIYIKFKNGDGFESISYSDSINLVMYTTAGGAITYSGTTPATSRTVNFNITVPANATEMQTSLNSDFSGATWVTAATTKQITTSAQGNFTAYVKFRDADLVEFTDTSWQSSFSVDIFASGTFSFALLAPNIDSPSAPNFALSSITYPGQATQMKVWADNNENSASWIALGSTTSINLTQALASCGSHTLYLKVKNAEGESQTSTSRSATYTCWATAGTSTTTGAPLARLSPSIVWTGTKFIVWAGYKCNGPCTYYNDGGFYDPALDSWTSLSGGIANTPTARYGSNVLWTGTEMIAWGGSQSGGAYLDPTGPAWTTIAAAPNGHQTHETTVWTGTKMIVWSGGMSSANNVGHTWTKAGNSWAQTTTTAAPDGRYGHTAVWTGTHMIVWGGKNDIPNYYLGDGAAYNPTTDTWTALPTLNAPEARNYHYAWTVGTKMYIWGGCTSSYSPTNTGAVYDFTAGVGSGTWTAMPTTNAPAGRGKYFKENYAQLTSDNKLLAFGGRSDCNDGSGSNYTDGGIFDPVTNAWTGIWSPGPAARGEAKAMWAPSLGKMLYWGGYLSYPTATNSGSLLSFQIP